MNEDEAIARQREILMKMRALMRMVLEKDAFERLERVKLANPSLYIQAIQTIYLLHQQGRIQGKLTDTDLKNILMRLRGKKKNTRIRIMEKG